MLSLLSDKWSMDWTQREKPMLSREEIEQMINQKIEPLTEEIAALKAQLSKVDLLAVDNRNIRQSLRRIETSQESLKLDFERQEKRSVHFERQTNDQLTEIKADTAALKEQLALVVTMLRRNLPPEEQW
jgi:hypothetical protein